MFITIALCHSKPRLGTKYQILNFRCLLRLGYKHFAETSKVEDKRLDWINSYWISTYLLI